MILKAARYISELPNRVLAFFKFYISGVSDEETIRCSKSFKSYADELRQVAPEYGLNHFPVILSSPESCASCETLTLCLMQPPSICGECWMRRLHAAIDRG